MLLHSSPVCLVGRFAGRGFYHLRVNSHSFVLLDTWDCNIPRCFPSVNSLLSLSLSLSLETGMLVKTEEECPFVNLDDSGKLFFLGRESRCLLWSLFWAYFTVIPVSCPLPEPQRDSSQIFIVRADGVPNGKNS